MSLLRIFFVPLLTLFLNACASSGSLSTADGDTNGTDIQQGRFWAVELHVTGGKAGMGRSIYVSNDGKLIVKDVRRKLYIEHLLTAAQRQAFADLLPAHDLVQPRPGLVKNYRGCIRCTHYDLALQRGISRSRIHVTGKQLAHSQYKKLIHKLANIQDRILRRYLRNK